MATPPVPAAPANWADDVDDDVGQPAAKPAEDKPPGFEGVNPSPGAAAPAAADGAASLADRIGAVNVSAPEEHMDAPDPASTLADPADVTAVSDTPYTSAATFEELPLSAELLQGLYTEMKFERPSRIQAVTLPMILNPPYKSMIAQAHNGSGKTTCFVLSMLSRVDPTVAAPQALCVCPTRELVVQNLDVLERMAKYTKITATSTASADGAGAAGEGASAAPRSKIIDHVIIGTHGKLKSWVARRVLAVNSVKILVFDEADEMLKTDAFASDSVRMITTVRSAVGSAGVQILLFSATFNDRVKAFAMKVVPDANQVFVPREALSLDVIKQYRVACPRPLDKLTVLKDMIFPQCEKLGQTIIFVRTRETARQLHAAMEGEGHKCTSIEGGMDKDARDRVVREFRAGTTKVLISTDVLSRGFDVTQVTLVVNYDVPTERDFRTPAYETYLHRIGRSGRFGRKGAAFNLVSGQAEAHVLDSIADYFQHRIPDVQWNDEDAFVKVLTEAGLSEGGVDV